MLSSIKKQTSLQLFCLFGFSLVIFTWGITSQEVTGFDSRFYLFALEMWDKGVGLFPTTYQKPYPDYTLASTLIIYLLAIPFGGVTKLTAVLPTAIAASFTILFTYLIGSLYNKRWGLYAVFLLFMTITFVQEARSIALDMYPTLFTTICFYLLLASDIKNKPKVSLWIYPFLVLGFVFRGPIGLVIPTSVVISYYLVDAKFKKSIIVAFASLSLLIICSIVLLLLAYLEGGDAFMQDVLQMQVLGRLKNSYEPIYFYFVNSIANYALSFPIFFIVMTQFIFNRGVLQKGFSNGERILVKLLAWTFIILIGMSIPGDKKTRYILPALPAIALYASTLFLATPAEKGLFFFRKMIFSLLTFFPLIFAAITLYAFFYLNQHHLDLHLPYLYTILCLFVMLIINLYFFSHQTLIVFNAALGFVITFISIVEPITLYMDRAHDFVTAIERERLQQRNDLVFYLEHPDGLAIKYLINMQKRENPQFIQSQDDLLKFSHPAYFVTSAHSFTTLPINIKSKLKVIGRDKMGHVEIVVFQKEMKL